MEDRENIYLNIELKPHYLNEFIICGIPVPLYTSTDRGFILKFEKPECYLNYVNVLKLILKELNSTDLDHFNYEIQRSKSFINNVLLILNSQFSKKYEQSV